MIATPKFQVPVMPGIDHGADSVLGQPISTTDLYWLRYSRQRKPTDPRAVSAVEDLREGFAAPVSTDLEAPARD
jgi:hypothetical protein